VYTGSLKHLVAFGIELRLSRGFYLLNIAIKYIFMERKEGVTGRAWAVLVSV
jgi:hypothetical protein